MQDSRRFGREQRVANAKLKVRDRVKIHGTIRLFTTATIEWVRKSDAVVPIEARPLQLPCQSAEGARKVQVSACGK